MKILPTGSKLSRLLGVTSEQTEATAPGRSSVLEKALDVVFGSVGTTCARAVGSVTDHIWEHVLASHWAPVFYQDTSGGAVRDYITSVNYDGDWRGDNNWENLYRSSSSLKPHVYHSLVETDTHCFITYAVFHPRDWSRLCAPRLPICHENDMEGATVVVEKDGSRYGKFVCVATQAHGDFHVYTNDSSIQKGELNNLEDTGVVLEGRSHPALFIETKGHGIYAMDPQRLEEGKPFPGGDGIVYRAGTIPNVPDGGNDRNVRYGLLSLRDELWARREDIGEGRLYDQPFVHEGRVVPGSFDGDTHAWDRANPPWGWASGAGEPRGDFFFRPAETLNRWLRFPEPLSTRYRYNPYLEDATEPVPGHAAMTGRLNRE